MTHHLRRTVSSIIRSPVSGPLAPALTTRFGGGLDGLGILHATGSTMLPGGRLLRQRGSGGSRRGMPTATSRLRGCSHVGISRFPPEHDVSDRLSLPLCCRELLRKALDSVAEEASLRAFRNCTFSCSMSVRHSQRWHSWTTSVDIAQPRVCLVTFMVLEARGPSQHTVHVEPQGHDHLRAGLSGLWAGEMWGISSYGRALT